MSGSSLDGLDIVFAEFTESAGKWDFTIKATACYPYEEAWEGRLKNAIFYRPMIISCWIRLMENLSGNPSLDL